MAKVERFKAFRPNKKVVEKFVCPPYDVVNTEEAREYAEGNDINFFHVTRSEIDFPKGYNPYDTAVYFKARENLEKFITEGVLQQNEKPMLYVYKEEQDGRSQVGIVGCVSIYEYEDDTIKKHELTRKAKEEDRIKHFDACDGNTEPVYFKGGEKFEKFEKPEKEGLITARSFGGTAKWRTCYTSDGTGHAVMCTMDNKCAQLGINVLDRKEAISLIHDGEKCMGAVVRCLRTGVLEIFLAKATVICTGGFGRIYKATTNAVICDGGGHVIAQDTGLVPIGNPESIQFHPTGIVPTDILVTEGCRGDGGTLLDVNEERFMHIYEPEKAELASRDVVARRMTEHMRAGKGVQSAYGEHLWLDIRHLGDRHISTKLREVDEICRHFLGIDPRTQLIPVRPTQHYTRRQIGRASCRERV